MSCLSCAGRRECDLIHSRMLDTAEYCCLIPESLHLPSFRDMSVSPVRIFPDFVIFSPIRITFHQFRTFPSSCSDISGFARLLADSLHIPSFPDVSVFHFRKFSGYSIFSRFVAIPSFPDTFPSHSGISGSFCVSPIGVGFHTSQICLSFGYFRCSCLLCDLFCNPAFSDVPVFFMYQLSWIKLCFFPDSLRLPPFPDMTSSCRFGRFQRVPSRPPFYFYRGKKPTVCAVGNYVTSFQNMQLECFHRSGSHSGLLRY